MGGGPGVPGGGFCGPGVGFGGPGGGFSDNTSSGKPLLLLRLKLFTSSYIPTLERKKQN